MPLASVKSFALVPAGGLPLPVTNVLVEQYQYAETGSMDSMLVYDASYALKPVAIEHKTHHGLRLRCKSVNKLKLHVHQTLTAYFQGMMYELDLLKGKCEKDTYHNLWSYDLSFRVVHHAPATPGLPPPLSSEKVNLTVSTEGVALKLFKTAYVRRVQQGVTIGVGTGFKASATIKEITAVLLQYPDEKLWLEVRWSGRTLVLLGRGSDLVPPFEDWVVDTVDKWTKNLTALKP